MLMKKIFFLILLTSNFVISQIYFPTNSQVKTVNNSYQAFTNATIHVSPYNVVKNATLLEKNGIIIAVGQNIDLPENTRIYDKSGKHLYASFIDLMTEFGIKKPIRNSSTGSRSAEYNSSRQGYYWNDHIL
ncbi:MAG: amidohydrolase, partial [Flavobacteriaceae bacterium]|nr:amidohydrolase [Flavobacteriaceae bacterium]